MQLLICTYDSLQIKGIVFKDDPWNNVQKYGQNIYLKHWGSFFFVVKLSVINVKVIKAKRE